jgi:hypothetical protein
MYVEHEGVAYHLRPLIKAKRVTGLGGRLTIELTYPRSTETLTFEGAEYRGIVWQNIKDALRGGVS